MSDLDCPLDAYKVHFRDLHARHVSEYFEGLLRASGVDETENAQLVSELAEIESEILGIRSARAMWRFIASASLVIVIAAVVLGISSHDWILLAIPLALGASAFLLSRVRRELQGMRQELHRVEQLREAKRNEAWLQMEPLNRLYSWGVATALFQKTFPEVRFDRYVSRGRQWDLISTYGLRSSFGDESSAVFSQSGSFEGNPFVFHRYLDHWMGTRSYSGSKFIQWTEVERNSQGELVEVRKSQTLQAWVTKPCPRYQTSTVLFYGHEAAPALSFERVPSNLSGLEPSRINDWRKERRVKKVERIARRQLSSGRGQLTLMANRDFEALFHATDRDDETAFRFLFTPLAQAEMVTLLKDTETGFGDDFRFTKIGPLNIIQSKHMSDAPLDSNPANFRDLDLGKARQRFSEFHAQYFKTVYFSLAPLLAVPSYRDQRSAPKPGNSNEQAISEWEHEAMAHSVGEQAFSHPQSITRNLLKTTSTMLSPDLASVRVTAHGYGGINRVDYVQVYGNDGRWHQVTVPWTEYYSVESSRAMLVGVVEDADPTGTGLLEAEVAESFAHALPIEVDASEVLVRGSLATCLLD